VGAAAGEPSEPGRASATSRGEFRPSRELRLVRSPPKPREKSTLTVFGSPANAAMWSTVNPSASLHSRSKPQSSLLQANSDSLIPTVSPTLTMSTSRPNTTSWYPLRSFLQTLLVRYAGAESGMATPYSVSSVRTRDRSTAAARTMNLSPALARKIQLLASRIALSASASSSDSSTSIVLTSLRSVKRFAKFLPKKKLKGLPRTHAAHPITRSRRLLVGSCVSRSTSPSSTWRCDHTRTDSASARV